MDSDTARELEKNIRKANDSIADVHERMPLLLKYQELEKWIRDDTRLEEFLHSEPHGLKREMEFEQQTLF